MEAAEKPTRVGFVGLGLIGGSLALALREADYAREFWAWDLRGEVLETGKSLGVIDTASTSLDEMLAAVDIVVLAAPTVACQELLPQVLSRVDGSVRAITDVASVKGAVCDALAGLDPKDAGRFVPGHPIAGSERSGVSAAKGELFRDHRVILTPLEHTDSGATAIVQTLWEAAGAQVSLMGVEEHDAVLAATSHLPHMLAYALVDALAHASHSEDIFRFAAGGFRDFTRIASSDPVMWRDVGLTNRAAILEALDGFETHLARLRKAIDTGDGEFMERTFRAAKSARDDFARRLDAAAAGSPDQGSE